MAENEVTETQDADQPSRDTSLPLRLLDELGSKRSRLLAEALLAVIRAQVESQPPELQAKFDGVSMLSVVMNLLDLFYRNQPRHLWLKYVSEVFLILSGSEMPKAEATRSEPNKEEPCSVCSTSP
jgi:hypothetical protein